MKQVRKLKILIFEGNQTLLRSYEELFEFHGHDVHAYTEPSFCALFHDSPCKCSSESPCADVLIAELQMNSMDGIEFFKEQKIRGCKLRVENQALMSTSISSEQKDAITELGCHFIKRPVNIPEIVKWLDGCAKRSI